MAAEQGVATELAGVRRGSAGDARRPHRVRGGRQAVDRPRGRLRPLTTALLVFGGIALFVGAFVIFNTFSITVAQRTRELALLRMLGASPRPGPTLGPGGGSCVGVVGSPVGLGVGLLAAIGLRALFNLIGANFPSDSLVLLPRTVIVSMGVGIVVTLLASLARAKFLVRAVFAALGLWVASELVPGVHFTDTGTLIVAAVLLGVVNAFVRPVVFILTLPLTVVTLGLFLLVVNATMIGLVAMLLGGFSVDGLIPGILAAIVTGVASWIGGMALRDDRRQRPSPFPRREEPGA